MLQLKTGCRAIALDNSQQMLTYAKGLAADSGATVQFQHGDMQTFKLQVKAVATRAPLPLANGKTPSCQL